MMVPDTRQRLETALADLQQCLVTMASMCTTQCFTASCIPRLHLQLLMVCRLKAAKLGIARNSNKLNWLLQMLKQYLREIS